jgi:hypothetical protein
MDRVRKKSTPYDTNFQVTRKKFYQGSHKFNYFRGVNEQELERIDELIESYKERIPKKGYSYLPNSNTHDYMNILNYLIHSKSLEYDDKVLFLIRYYDPDLKLLTLYLESDRMDKKEIEEETNEYVKKELMEKKEKLDVEFQVKCREIAGIYDPMLIQYEQILAKRLNKVLRFNVKKDYIKSFFNKYVTDDINLTVTEEELNDCLTAAREYKEKYGIPNINDLAYQLLNQSNVIDIKSNKKAMIFMIYVLDEELKCYDIYEEYCNWKEISKECIENVGFFNKELIDKEIKYSRDNGIALK